MESLVPPSTLTRSHPHTAIFHNPTFTLPPPSSSHPHYRWTILADRRWTLVVLRITAVPMKPLDSSVMRTGWRGGWGEGEAGIYILHSTCTLESLVISLIRTPNGSFVSRQLPSTISGRWTGRPRPASVAAQKSGESLVSFLT